MAFSLKRKKDEYLQFVIRRETFKQRKHAQDGWREEEDRFGVGTGERIKLKGKKDQREDADDSALKEMVYRAHKIILMGMEERISEKKQLIKKIEEKSSLIMFYK